MCANYRTIKDAKTLARFGVDQADPMPAWPLETYPQYQAPFIRRIDGEAGTREAALGMFGMVPHWSKDLAIGRRCYNARSETASEKPTFRDAWKYGRRCIIPLESFYEANWETGKAVRWKIWRADDRPAGVAGLWTWWRSSDGVELLSMTMLTINADGHHLMQRFHKPGDEKRMIVVLDEAEYDAWLDAPQREMMSFMRRYPAADLQAVPEPKSAPAPARSLF